VIDGVAAGSELGFFLTSGADLMTTDVLVFKNQSNADATLDDGNDLLLTVDGDIIDGVTVFHSYDGAMNADLIHHVSSGSYAGGNALLIGFEDQMGGGDLDYQDVLFEIEQNYASLID
jgi:hypothetical protein